MKRSEDNSRIRTICKVLAGPATSRKVRIAAKMVAVPQTSRRTRYKMARKGRQYERRDTT
jgi:hypothetical protein